MSAETHPSPSARPNLANSRRGFDTDGLGRAAAITLLALLTGWLAFADGGFTPGPTAVAAVLVLGAVLVLVTSAAHPLAGLTRWGVLAAGAFTLLATWTLISATWSHAPGRALVEFDRALLYLAAFVLMACLPHSRANARWLVRLTTLALATAVLAGLLGRLAPGLGWQAALESQGRLAWPLGYWNALGLAAALAGVGCLHLGSDLREPRPVRVMAAALVPALGVAVYLTLSRGSIAAASIGVVVLLGLARSRGTAAMLLAVIPGAAYALWQVLDAPSLLEAIPATTPAARDEAAAVLRAVVVAGVAAALLRIMGLWLDARLARLSLWKPWSARRTAVVLATVAGLLVAAALVADADSIVAERWQEFSRVKQIDAGNQSGRLSSVSANGRIEHWQVALGAWREDPLLGTGAGTYALAWARERPGQFNVQDAHSLPFDMLSDLGVVGLALVVAAFVLPMLALLRRRAEDRVLWSAVLAIVLTWAVHAGIDWDWELPALTLPIIALLGVACASPRTLAPRGYAPGRTLRLLAGLGVLLLIVTPVRVGLSQRNLERSLAAFQAGDCTRSAEHALAAIDALGSRPQGFELLGYCDAKVGQHVLAERMLRAAIKRDSGSWDLHYGLALVRSVAGQDPRPELRRARRMNPLEPAVGDAMRRMRSDRPAVWVREGRRSSLPLPVRE